jgi:hypothetical protein
MVAEIRTSAERGDTHCRPDTPGPKYDGLGEALERLLVDIRRKGAILGLRNMGKTADDILRALDSAFFGSYVNSILRHGDLL